MAASSTSRRFWVVYTAAWLPYTAVYVATSFVVGSPTVFQAVVWTLCNVAPAALLGLGVLRFCDRLPWSRSREYWFFPVHIGAAAAYAVCWVAGLMLLIAIEQSIAAGTWSPITLSSIVVSWNLLIGVMIYCTIASVAYVLQVTTRLREQEARAERAEALRAMAELKALRAQLNPHFLFNTLHSLMALVRHDPQAAEDALERFGELLRYVLKAGKEDGDESDDVSLHEEWTFVQNYLALEKIRLADRLQVEARIAPDSLECTVPAFTLQPLVENAIKHAITPRVRGGKVTIVSRIDGDEVVIEVEDDGPGAAPAALEETSGLGLRAVHQRLELRYPGRARFSFATAPDRGVSVRIRVPAERPEDRR
jgi:signal transduction histidine kinase